MCFQKFENTSKHYRTIYTIYFLLQPPVAFVV